MGGEERKNKGGETQSNSQDLDPTGSPHLEEIWFGGIVDLDPLSVFPLKGGKNHGGKRRNQALKRSTMEERESFEAHPTIGDETPFYRRPRKMAVGEIFHSHWEAGLAGSEAGLVEAVRREASLGPVLGRLTSFRGRPGARDGQP